MLQQNKAWKDAAIKEAWERAQEKMRVIKSFEQVEQYTTSPVDFGTELLGENYTDDVIEVMNSVKDNPVTIARSANAVGKSHSAARLCTWFYLVFPDSQVYVTAAPPAENLTHVLWGEIMSVVTKHRHLFEGHTIRSKTIARPESALSALGVDKGSFISRLTIPTSGSSAEREAKFSGKHSPHLLFIVDEGDAVPEEVYRGIESCLSGQGGRLLIMFNPRSKRGPVYLKERLRQANVIELSALRHPNVIKGKNVIPGAVSRDITVRRIHDWTRPVHEYEKEDGDSSLFSVPDFLVGSTARTQSGSNYPPLEAGQRKIIDPKFNYMVLGQYPAQSVTQLISDEWIDKAVENWHEHVKNNGERPIAGVQPIMGLDMAEYGVDYNVLCLRYGNWVPKLAMWNGVDPDYSAMKAIDIYKNNKVSIAMVDGTGVGSGVAPSMVRKGRDDGLDVRAISVKVSEKPSPVYKLDKGEFYLLRDQIYWLLREWLKLSPKATLPPDGYLLEELRAMEYQEDSRGRIRVSTKKELREVLKRSTDRSDALALTFSPFERPRWMRLVGDGPAEMEQTWTANKLETQPDGIFAQWDAEV